MGDEKALRRTVESLTRDWRNALKDAALQRDVNRDLSAEIVRLRAEVEQLRRGYQDARFTGYEFRHAQIDDSGKVIDTVYDECCADIDYARAPHKLVEGWHPQWRRLYTSGPWYTGVPEQALEELGRGVAVWLAPDDPDGR